jgi:putative CocE/NonD family hydrolase
MRIVETLPAQITVHEHIWIPLPDGQRLAARIWLPADAEARPVPAILEYIPYRKRDLTRGRDDMNHPYLAAHGYACLRVDLRGSGESDGVLRDQYLEQEQQDGEEVIAWIAAQSWCDGTVGMFGVSWGGFAALQVAARRPPALQAVVSVCATDDLYIDNMHYMGGCLLGDNLSEATTMFAFNACPPDPQLVGARWRDLWLERLAGSGMWLDIWLRHQRRDTFWKPGSISEDYAAIQCPVLAVSGWADGFSNAVFRLLQHLEVPCQGLIGPWNHRYPHLGEPGPAIGFLQETLRWFDHWLKGRATGLEQEPGLRVWMQDTAPPQTMYKQRPGRWVAERGWPSPRIEQQDWFLTQGCLRRGAPADGDRRTLRLRSPLTTGLFAGKWCSYPATPDLPADQRLEDGGALVFETDDLDRPLEILGSAVCELELSSDRPLAMIAARLSDVRPDGSVTRVTYGLFNLTHRHGHEQPQALEPGRVERIQVVLNGVAQRFPAGHRIRLALSTSYWPLAWPSPEPVELGLRIGHSRLQLPVRAPDPADAMLRPFAEPEAAPPTPIEVLQEKGASWQVHHDLATGTSTLDVVRDDGRARVLPIDLIWQRQTLEWYSSTHDDPLSARGETRTDWSFSRGDWLARTRTRTVLTCDRTHFRLYAELDAFEHDQRVYAQTWDERIPRDLV